MVIRTVDGHAYSVSVPHEKDRADAIGFVLAQLGDGELLYGSEISARAHRDGPLFIALAHVVSVT